MQSLGGMLLLAGRFVVVLILLAVIAAYEMTLRAMAAIGGIWRVCREESKQGQRDGGDAIAP